ncbi:hypothetical protein I4U23_013378 [Adineta vaga]|nr:hypothetical protein I4U23_013378 [Adineta vaga]
MLPICSSQPMLMPVVPQMFVPMVPIQAAPMFCPPNYMNLCSTTTMSSEGDSRMYGRFRHVERELPGYRHAPFDWYRPPKQRFNVIHEDAAVVTLDGPMPIGDFYRHYIYGDDMDDYDYDYEYDDDDDDGGDASSYESEEYGNTSRNTGSSRRNRNQGNLNYREGRNSNIPLNQQSNRTDTYSTLDPIRRRNIPPPSNTRRKNSTAGDDDFDDAASVNSTYGN